MSHECSECGSEFESEDDLEKHVSQEHDSDTVSVEIPKPKFSKNNGFALMLLIGMIFGFSAGYVSPDLRSLIPQGDPKVDLSAINNSDDPVLGQNNASVTMVIYEDFQCPFCKRYEDRTVSQVKSNYIDSGQVKLVWKDYPLRRRHPQAQITSEVMECVNREDEAAFWDLKDRIFNEHDNLYPRTAGGYDTNEEEVKTKIIDWAVEEGLSRESINTCLEEGNPEEAVQQDLDEGQSFNTTIPGPGGERPFVSGTPGTVIYKEGDSEGVPIVGAQPFNVIDKTIKEKLEN